MKIIYQPRSPLASEIMEFFSPYGNLKLEKDIEVEVDSKTFNWIKENYEEIENLLKSRELNINDSDAGDNVFGIENTELIYDEDEEE